jgi:hypothetical protein
MRANGDLASPVVFGGLAFLTPAGSRQIAAKKDRSADRGWAGFKAATPWPPFPGDPAACRGGDACPCAITGVPLLY